MNDFTKKYAELISRYVDIDDMEHFHEDFEELLDAYENDDEPAKVIHRDATPDEIAAVVKSAFGEKREEPEVGEVYRDVFGNKYIILGVHDSFPDGEPVKKPFILFARMVDNNLNEAYTLPLEDFFNPAFVKE